jgi:WD40-like Beta Propeller Repeat
MRRRRGLVFPVAAMCVLLAGCAHASPGRERPPPAGILVSVSGRAVFLVDPPTGDRRTLVDGLRDFQDGYAAWGPGRTVLAYADGGILVLDPRTNRTRTLVRGSQFSMPAWSPDGTELTYGDGVAVWLTPAGAERTPSPRRIAGIPAVIGPVDMDWSSVGAIAFEGVQLDCSAAVRCSSTGASEIWKVQPDGTGLLRLTSVGHAERPRWAADGNRLLFVRSYPGAGDRRELWRTDAVGSAPRRVLGVRDVVAADWSPDGRSVAVLRRGPGRETLTLWVARADGTALRQVGGAFGGAEATVDW